MKDLAFGGATTSLACTVNNRVILMIFSAKANFPTD
jgi:hypothetical protein